MISICCGNFFQIGPIFNVHEYLDQFEKRNLKLNSISFIAKKFVKAES